VDHDGETAGRSGIGYRRDGDGGHSWAVWHEPLRITRWGKSDVGGGGDDRRPDRDGSGDDAANVNPYPTIDRRAIRDAHAVSVMQRHDSERRLRSVVADTDQRAATDDETRPDAGAVFDTKQSTLLRADGGR